MTIAVKCQCGKRYKVADDKAGKRFKCAACAVALKVPQPSVRQEDDWWDDGVDDEHSQTASSSAKHASSSAKQRKPQSRKAKRKKSKSGLSPIVHVSIGAGVFVVLVVAGFYYFNKESPSKDERLAANDNNKTSSNPASPAGTTKSPADTTKTNPPATAPRKSVNPGKPPKLVRSNSASNTTPRNDPIPSKPIPSRPKDPLPSRPKEVASIPKAQTKSDDLRLAKGEELLKIETGANTIYSIEVSADGKSIFSGESGGVPKIRGIQSGNLQNFFEKHQESVGAVALSRDGKRALTGSWDRTMRLWDRESGNLIRVMRGHRWPVLTLAISPDGKRALSGSDGFRLWDLKSGRMLHHFTGHTRTVWALTFSPDGNYALSGSWDRTIRLWNLKTFRQVRVFRGHLDRVKCVRFSPDGKFAVSCDTGDRLVRLWEIKTGRQVRTFVGHTAGVASVAFSPDGRYILSSGGQLSAATGSYIPRAKEKSIRLWDVATGKQLLQINGHADYVASVVFTPDGRKAVSGSGDGTIRVWRLFEDVKRP